MKDLVNMAHCWEIRGCDEEMQSRCPHAVANDNCLLIAIMLPVTGRLTWLLQISSYFSVLILIEMLM